VKLTRLKLFVGDGFECAETDVEGDVFKVYPLLLKFCEEGLGEMEASGGAAAEPRSLA